MKHALIAVMVFGAASTAFAQDFQVGARSKGMGGSYTAFEDDPTSIWTLPTPQLIAINAAAKNPVGVAIKLITQGFGSLSGVQPSSFGVKSGVAGGWPM